MTTIRPEISSSRIAAISFNNPSSSSLNVQMTALGSVSIITSQVVHAHSEASWQSLRSVFPLGPLDALVPAFIPIAVVFYYPRPDHIPSKNFIDINLLHTALSRVLDLYPHLTGRLTPSAGGRTVITQLGSGAELIDARCDARLNELSDEQLMTGSGDLLGSYDISEEGIKQGAIVRVQHTRFKCGSVALGVRLSHKVCDGEGYFRFMRDLAGLYRAVFGVRGDKGKEEMLEKPIFESHLSHLSLDSEEKAKAREHQSSIMYTVSSPPTQPMPTTEVTPAPSDISPSTPRKVVGRFIHYSSDSLSSLKVAAHSSSLNISTFTALSAFLFQHITQARLLARHLNPQLPILSPPQFLTPVGVRSRLSLHSHYFSNALICSCATPPISTLTNGSLSEIAEYIHSAARVPAVSDIQEIDKDLKWISSQEDIGNIRHIFQGGSGGVQISSWSRLGLYDGVEYEVQPRMIIPPFTEISLIDGLGYLLPTRSGEGMILAMALSEEVWETLGDKLERLA